MRNRLFALLVILAIFILPFNAAISISGPKGEEFVIASGQPNQLNPTIWGRKVSWFQYRLGYWGYTVYFKDLNTGTITALSQSDTHLPFVSDVNKLSLNNKYCWWTAYSLKNFYNYEIFVYDINQKQEMVFGDDKSQLSNPVIWSEYLFYTRKSLTLEPSLEIWVKRLNSNDPAKLIYTYDLKANNYSVHSVDNGYAVWTDQGDLFLYDVNKDKLTRITKTNETEYFPLIQNGIIYFNKLSYLNWNLVYTIYAYNIKEETIKKINNKDAYHWQRPSFNPTANNFIFTQWYQENGKNIYALCLYDPKQDITKEIQKFPAMPVINSQCSSKDYLVWIDNTSGEYQLKFYNYKTDETFVLNKTILQESSPRIDGNTIVWNDSRNGNQDIYGFTVKEK